MSELAIRHIEYDSIADPGPVGVVWQEHKLRVWVHEFFDEPWARNSIDFNFLAGDPFHDLDSFRGSLVLVCGRCGRSLRRTSNLYQARREPYRRRRGGVCSR